MYYDIEPEVPGHIGDNTVIDRPVHPVIISKLQYVFDAVPDDVLITSSPVYLLKRDAKPDLEAIQPTGVEFDKVQVSKLTNFEISSGIVSCRNSCGSKSLGKPATTTLEGLTSRASA